MLGQLVSTLSYWGRLSITGTYTTDLPQQTPEQANSANITATATAKLELTTMLGTLPPGAHVLKGSEGDVNITISVDPAWDTYKR